jgi:DNA-binding transcriptional LysR family regulator
MSAGAEGGLSYLSLRRPSTRPRSPTYARQNGWCRASVIFKPETLESMYEFLPTWRSVIFATMAWIRRSATAGARAVEGPPDLLRHSLLHVSLYPDDWQRCLTMAGYADMKVAGRQTFDDTMVVLQAAINGLGVAQGRHTYVNADIAAGRLVKLFDMALPQETVFYVVSPSATQDHPKVAAFRDWILVQNTPEAL